MMMLLLCSSFFCLFPYLHNVIINNFWNFTDAPLYKPGRGQSVSTLFEKDKLTNKADSVRLVTTSATNSKS